MASALTPGLCFRKNSLQWDSDTGTDFAHQQSRFPELSAQRVWMGDGVSPGAGVGSRAQGTAVSLMSAVDPMEPQIWMENPHLPTEVCARNARLS